MANGLPGRPTLYTEDMADFICERLSMGETLLEVCRDNERVADRATVTRWLVKNPEFASRIMRARDFGQDASIDQCREIIENATPENVNVAKLQVWHRQWEASKRARRNFGDKVDVSHSTSPIDTMTDEQVEQELLRVKHDRERAKSA